MEDQGFYVTVNSTSKNQRILSSCIPQSLIAKDLNYEIGLDRINITTNKKKCTLQILCPQLESLSLVDDKLVPILRFIDMKQLTWSYNFTKVHYFKLNAINYIDFLIQPSKFDCEGLQVDKISITVHIRPSF